MGDPLQPAGAVAPPRPLRPRGRVVVALLALAALLNAFAVIADIGELGIINRVLDGEDVPQREIDVAYDRFRVAGELQWWASLAIIPAWLAWIWRAYADLPYMGAGADRRFKTGWAIGSWFVPILNFWRPKQIVNDVWRGTEPDPDGSVAASDRSVPAWLAVWWGGWLLVGWATRISRRLLTEADTLAEQRSSTIFTLICDIAWIPVDLLALAVVVAITQRWEHGRLGRSSGPSLDGDAGIRAGS